MRNNLLLLFLLCALGGRSAGAADPVTVHLLAINDLHGNLEPPGGADGLVNGVQAGGVEYLATHLAMAVQRDPNALIVAAGDLTGAAPLISALFHDRPTIRSLNALHLTVSSIGNHELDDGLTGLQNRIAGLCPDDQGCPDGATAEPARFQYLAANLRAATAAPLPARLVVTVGGVKVGFIGETLQGTGEIIAAASAKGLDFLEETRIANDQAAQMEAEGVHALVLLIHQGGRQRPGDGPVDPNGCADFEGDLATLLPKLSPAIKVVISGHTHQMYNCQIDGHLVTSAGYYGRLYTDVALSIDPDSDRIIAAVARNQVVTRDVAKDPAQTAILEQYRPQAARIANRVVGSTTLALTRADSATGESALGDLITDAQLAATRDPEQGGARLALTNSGGIRANIQGPAEPPAPRDISFGDLYAVQPFGNRLTVVTLTGATLLRLLEQQFPVDGSRNILQVSQGFSYQYRLTAPPGHHVVPESLTLMGRKIRPEDTIRVAASDFLTAGKGGFTVFREATDPVIDALDVDALVAYVSAHSPLSAPPLNRIIRLD